MEIEASSYLSSAAVQPSLCWSWSNYRLFSHGVVSYMLNEESDNVVLEYRFTHYVKAGLSLHWAHIQCRILLSYWCMFHLNEPRLEKTAQLVS